MEIRGYLKMRLCIYGFTYSKTVKVVKSQRDGCICSLDTGNKKCTLHFGDEMSLKSERLSY